MSGCTELFTVHRMVGMQCVLCGKSQREISLAKESYVQLYANVPVSPELKTATTPENQGPVLSVKEEKMKTFAYVVVISVAALLMVVWLGAAQWLAIEGPEWLTSHAREAEVNGVILIGLIILELATVLCASVLAEGIKECK